MTCLFITGFQRSGTTVLGEAMGLAASVAYWGEIFHPEGVHDGPRADALMLRPAANYFRFRVNALTSETRGEAPDFASRIAEWDAYLATLDRLQPGATHVLNVKYSSWHNLNLAWQNPSEPPFLLDLAMQRNYSIAHCLRRDALAQALSESLALATDVWHVRAGQDPPPPPAPVEIDPNFVLRRLRTSVAETELYRTWLGAGHSTEIFYEDLFDAEGRFSAAAQQAIQKDIPDWRPDRDPPLRRIGREARASVANIDELRIALMRSEFAELASNSL